MKKFAVGALTLATAGTALLGSTGIADAVPGQGTYNVRSGPGTQYQVIGKIHNPTCDTLHHNGWKEGHNWTRSTSSGQWFFLPRKGGWVYSADHGPLLWCTVT